MKKKEISRKKYILLLCLAFLLVIAGFAIKHNANKPEVSNEEQLYQLITSGNAVQNTTGQIADLNDAMMEQIGQKQTEEGTYITYYDYSQVPERPDGVKLFNNTAWQSYYCECRHADAYTIPDNVSNRNLNSVVINGVKYSIPFDVEELPEDGEVQYIPYSIVNASERFYGNVYCRMEDEIQIGNEFYVQTYPETTMVNAVSVQYEGMLYDDTISMEIADIKVGMKEEDVIRILGEGTPSSNYTAIWFQEKYHLTESVHPSTIYCNSTGVVVVTYDDSRHVISVSLYTAALRRDLDDEVLIEVYQEN